MNVIEIVVKNDFCIGCGVCAGICPSNNLHMDWSSQGELIPYENNDCSDKCSICLDVCPFYDHKINQDNIAEFLFSKIPKIDYNEYAGYHLNCYVGFQKDDKKRLKSASGGLATSFLSSLLEKNIVDKIVAVGANENNRMFDFKILSNPKEVYSSAGSAYYPVEISLILKKILEEKDEKSYAIIALPCVVYALRLAMEKIPKLERKIKIIASLTCGQLQNRFCTELLALESGIKVDELLTIDFRRKSRKNPASNFMQVSIDKDGNDGIHQPYQKLPFHLWYYHYFKQNACNYCDDVFGEVADVTFMDAWLPEYIDDHKGTSLVIVRTSAVQKLLESSKESVLNNINVQRVVESQNGPIQKKRTFLKGRIYEKELLGLFYPKKRVNSDESIYIENKKFIELTSKIQNLSKKIWTKHRLDKSTEEFWKELKYMESNISKYERNLKILSLIKTPITLFKTILR